MNLPFQNLAAPNQQKRGFILQPSFPRPTSEMWLEKARQRFGNLPAHELREAAEWMEQEATNGLSSHLA